MKLIVVRHGETDMNKEDRLQGTRGEDLPLNDIGRGIVTKLRDVLLLSPEVIYASPLLRTQETAKILNERFNVNIITEPKLVERDFGTLSGKKRSEVDPRLIELDLEGHYDYRPFGGEAVDDVILRITDFIDSLRRRNEKVVMLVTHRGVVRILYDLFPSESSGENITPGSKHVFELPDIAN